MFEQRRTVCNILMPALLHSQSEFWAIVCLFNCHLCVANVLVIYRVVGDFKRNYKLLESMKNYDRAGVIFNLMQVCFALFRWMQLNNLHLRIARFVASQILWIKIQNNFSLWTLLCATKEDGLCTFFPCIAIILTTKSTLSSRKFSLLFFLNND